MIAAYLNDPFVLLGFAPPGWFSGGRAVHGSR